MWEQEETPGAVATESDHGKDQRKPTRWQRHGTDQRRNDCYDTVVIIVIMPHDQILIHTNVFVCTYVSVHVCVCMCVPTNVCAMMFCLIFTYLE